MSTIIGTTLNADTIRKTGGSLGTDIRIKNTSVYESDGGTSVTQNLVQGLAKVWVKYTCTSTTASDSFNVSGLTDNGTGDFTTTFANDMSNANYCVPTSCNHVNASATLYGNNPHTYATGSVRCDSFETNASPSTAQLDTNHNSVSVNGDLA